MFTNNYIALRHNLFFGVTSQSSITTSYGKIRAKSFTSAWGGYASQYDSCVKDIGNTMNLPQCKTMLSSETTSSGADNYRGIYFGTGSTPASLTDYALESPITTGLVFAGGLVGISAYEDGKAEATARYIVTNTSNAEINIWEIGCFAPLQTSNATNNGYAVIMLERTVLTEPITIPAGEAKMVTYKVVFNQ
jgi:hypothetical protein